MALLLGGLLLVGTALCMPLYKWDIRKLIHSSLFLKIVWWIPIFFVLMAVLYGQLLVASIVVVALLVQAFRELLKNKGLRNKAAVLYYVVFSIFLVHTIAWFIFIPSMHAVTLLAVVAIASVLSDVCAFFMGNYMGRHPLPKIFNNRKSWEGVAGQIIGAFIGSALAALVLNVVISLSLVLLIGLASAAGDLINSYVKRSLVIKDWGNTIPGHGGVLDRLSSLSFAIAVSYWFIVLIL
jgi:phosphatidate cytidylyltransferase